MALLDQILWRRRHLTDQRDKANLMHKELQNLKAEVQAKQAAHYFMVGTNLKAATK